MNTKSSSVEGKPESEPNANPVSGELSDEQLASIAAGDGGMQAGAYSTRKDLQAGAEFRETAYRDAYRFDKRY